MSPTRLTKLCLAILALAALSIGIPALLAPMWFYDSYPAFTAWVGQLPPYNEHLVTDVGGLYLGFGLLFVWALYKPSRQLILPVCLTFLVVQVLHFIFHIGHLGGFSTFEAVSQTIALGVIVLASLVPVMVLYPRRSA